MPLEVGSRLGHYDVTALIGEGGMGQVYQATDTKLNRQVALKILPEAFATDPDRLARFQREAQVLASLNHPGIAAIYGIEESDDIRALVLELVEGPTLADRIAQGPIPVDEALPIAKQIAEALEAAHEAGVIHRDLKPANIKVKDDGTVKVLDFGLAKALDTTPEGDPSQSPTLTAAATQMGVIMGTAAYMSPEQARGKPVDKRADIWAFGAVLYEMLSGKRAFQGEDVSLTLAEVMKSDPDLSSLPADTTPALRSALTRCLTKDPSQRVRDIGDVRLAMEGAFETTASAPVEPPAAARRQVWQRPVAGVGIVVVAVLVTALAAATVMRPEAIPSPHQVHFAVVPPDTAALITALNRRDIAISPDGTLIVYVGIGPQLYLRSIDQLDAVPLRGAEGGTAPFFSPGGEWVGFLDSRGRVLQKVSVFGGPPVILTESEDLIIGASWGTDDRIIFGTSTGGLERVSGGGGEPEPLTTVDTEERNHLWPSIIPGREAVVFVINPDIPLTDGQLGVFDLETGDVTPLGLAGVSPHYVSTGHLVYGAEDGSVRAVPFDASALEVTGNPVPLVENVVVKDSGAANFSISDAGSLAYVPGRGPSTNRTLALVDLNGGVTSLNVPPAPYRSPRLSPDGGKLAVQTADDDGDVLWLYDLAGDTQIQQLTFDGDNQRPVWTPDSERITFSSDRDGTMSLYWMPADGSGVAERLTTADEGTSHWSGSWSPDGQTLLLDVQRDLRTDWDMWSLSANGRETQSLSDAPDTVYAGAALSPNGQWLAYGSGPDFGGLEVYVEPFPRTGSRRKISQNGGYWPLWSPDGDRLFYRPNVRTGERTLRSVDVVTEPDFGFRNEETLPIEGFSVVGYYRDYDIRITPDGERFVMTFPADPTATISRQINVVLNWFEELERLLPTN